MTCVEQLEINMDIIFDWFWGHWVTGALTTKSLSAQLLKNSDVKSVVKQNR
jgi:hypothetical protein